MSFGFSGHQAHYDANGNIILPGIESAPFEEKNIANAGTWHTISEDGVTIIEMTAQGEITHTPINKPIVAIAKETKNILETALREGEKQLFETGKDAKEAMRDFAGSLRNAPARIQDGMDKVIELAALPVVHSEMIQNKPRSRAALFIFDTIRFGGTFAFIFTVLFVGVNYRSFWDIAKAQLALGDDTRQVEALEKLVEESTVDSVFAAGLSGATIVGDSSVMSFLPPVGPPDNRLIIPKLGKNIPITIPQIDSLLNEDWKKFEEDVQSALREGVVHYPGTARPGQAGNFFVTGHSSYYPWDSGKFKDVFARLHELKIGDTYSVYYGGDLHTYRVSRIYEVKPSDVSVLDQPSDKRLSTLMTCTPIGTTLRRLIVQAEEIDAITHQVLAVGEKGNENLRPAKLDELPI